MIEKNPRVNIEMELSSCGRKCFECKSYSIECLGCYHTREKLPERSEEGMCPIYECSMKRNSARSCSVCQELPCELFNICINPEMNKMEIQSDIENRVRKLKGLNDRRNRTTSST